MNEPKEGEDYTYEFYFKGNKAFVLFKTEHDGQKVRILLDEEGNGNAGDVAIEPIYLHLGSGPVDTWVLGWKQLGETYAPIARRILTGTIGKPAEPGGQHTCTCDWNEVYAHGCQCGGV